MAKVLVPLANGFEDIEAVAIVDVLRRGGVEVVTASIHETPDVRSAHGIPMKADALFSSVSDGDFDAIVLPGGGEGTENLRNCEPLHQRLRRQNEEHGLLCAICAAPTVLVAAGALDEHAHAVRDVAAEVALYDKVIPAGDTRAVDREDLVVRHEPGFRGGAAFGDIADDGVGAADPGLREEVDQPRQEDCEDDVAERAGEGHDHAPPRGDFWKWRLRRGIL